MVAIDVGNLYVRNFVLGILSDFTYRFFWFLGLIILKMPLRLKFVWSHLFAILVFRVFRFRRRVVLHNLSWVFPRKTQESMGDFESRILDLGFKNYLHYGWMVLELFERFHWTDDVIQKKVKFTGAEHVWDALKKGRGFFFLTAHLGNWELITRVGVYLGFPLTIVTKSLRNAFWDRVWIRSRKEFGLELLEESGSGLGIVRGIRNKKGVGFILDQHTGRPHGVQARFLGVSGAWTPKGLAVLSSRLECPVIPAYMVRDNDGNFVLTIEKPLQLPIARDDIQILEHIEICNRNIEKWIFEFPEQYLWIHKRFKEIPGRVYSSKLPWEL